MKSEWADYAPVQAQCGKISGNELIRNLSANTRPRSSQFAEPLWTDPGISGISVRELIVTSEEKKKKKEERRKERKKRTGKRRNSHNCHYFMRSMIVCTSIVPQLPLLHAINDCLHFHSSTTTTTSCDQWLSALPLFHCLLSFSPFCVIVWAIYLSIVPHQIICTCLHFHGSASGTQWSTLSLSYVMQSVIDRTFYVAARCIIYVLATLLFVLWLCGFIHLFIDLFISVIWSSVIDLRWLCGWQGVQIQELTNVVHCLPRFYRSTSCKEGFLLTFTV